MTDVGRVGGLGPDEFELDTMLCRLGLLDMMQTGKRKREKRLTIRSPRR